VGHEGPIFPWISTRACSGFYIGDQDRTAEGRERGGGSWGRVQQPHLRQLRGLGNAVISFSGVRSSDVGVMLKVGINIEKSEEVGSGEGLCLR